jgi:predicted ATP-grasp superfamily ATP-dependent carboligase
MIPMDTRTPVLVLNCKLGGLAIMRSLGRLGVPVFGVDGETRSPGFLSRYCRGKHLRSYEEKGAKEYLELVLRIGERLGDRSILIPTSDELSVFVAENRERLSRRFRFPEIDPDVVRGLISKKGMYGLALRHGVPSPLTLFPKSLEDVHAFAEEVQFPVMLKGIHGNRLYARTGKKMVLSGTREELVKNYVALEDPEVPNLMIQEYIPGGDDQIYIFNGYFDENSDCLAAFTGHKIRQYPVHVGCASLGICRWNQTVADTTIRFMKALGYKGILDIGYRLDPRDGQYKVLDINPRVGQAFRLFLAVDETDVVRTLYRNLTGQGTGPPIVPREGRRWLIEDYDIESSLEYFREGTLTFREWAASFRGVEEAAWFDWRDPFPFLGMCGNLSRKTGRWMWKLAFPGNAGQR